MSTYTVMVLKDHKPGEAVAWSAWEDIATVKVPPRTKRRGIIAKALAEAGYVPGDGGPDGLKVRVLDAASARETPVVPKAHDPEWAIG